MTTTSSNSLFGLDDIEALLWGPSCPTVDPLTSPLFRPGAPEDGGETLLEGGGSASPLSLLSSSSSSSSPPPLYSPSPSPPSALLQRDKADDEEEEGLPALPWLGRGGVRPHCGKGDAFSGLDWMSVRMDLREFDLDSLIGSCSPGDEPTVCPEDLLSSLDCSMDLDDLALPRLPLPGPALPRPPSRGHRQEVPLSPPLFVPEPQEELEIKSEPISPPPPAPPPASYTLDLGSEVDVAECEVKPVVMGPSAPPRGPRIVLSLPPTRIVVVVAPREDAARPTKAAVATPVIRAVAAVSAAPRPPPASAGTWSPRSRPYPEPHSRHALATASTSQAVGPKTTSPSSGGDEGKRGGGGAARQHKEKKQKKKEQNKTAATRYRQKKRVEHDHLHTEYVALEHRNGELKETADSLAREIQYLKELMEEVRQAKSRSGSGC